MNLLGNPKFMFNKISKHVFTFIALALLILLQPVGFDFFYHLYYLQDVSLHISLNMPHNLLGINIDRYMAFPYIIYALDYIKPLLLIMLFQIVAWYKPMLWAIEKRDNLAGFAVFLLILFFCVFWTPLGISIGFASSYIISKNKFSLLYLLVSILFHPVAILIALIAPFFKKISMINRVFCIFSTFTLYLLTIFVLNNISLLQEFNILSAPIINSSSIKKLDSVLIKSSAGVQNLDFSEIGNTVVRTPIVINKSFILIFKKSKEIILCFILFLMLSSGRFLILKIPMFIYSLITLIIFTFLISKSLTNGSVLASFFITPDKSKYYDYSIYLAKNSYSSPNINLALSRIDDDCFYSFNKFALNNFDNKLSNIGLIKNCYAPSLYSLSIPLGDREICLRKIRQDPLFRDSTILHTIQDNRIVFYSLINVYIPNYKSVTQAGLLCGVANEHSNN